MVWKVSHNPKESHPNEGPAWDVQLPNKEWITVDAVDPDAARVLAQKVWDNQLTDGGFK